MSKSPDRYPMTPRLRFAPSPTGNLHIGTLRTALFNWIYAKSVNGAVAIRIEDTDLARSDVAFEANIFDGLDWLQLGMDEGPREGGDFGPYRQSERNKNGIYRDYANRLLDNGLAYRCFCSETELDAERQLADHQKRPYMYSGKCKRLSENEVADKSAQGIPHTIKFSVPSGDSVLVRDLIRGDILFDRTLIGDFVLFKSDGMPSYNFAVVVDDGLMAVTHVVRGEDHISNTPKQIMLFEALGFDVPRFAHLPMILGPDKSKLSKRHGATSVTDYRSQGILPDAMFNYLVLLGWSSPDGQELLTRDDIIERFSFDRISKSGAVFDMTKLKWMNGQYIRRLDRHQLVAAATPFLSDFTKVGLARLGDARGMDAIYSIRDNLDFLTDADRYLDVYLVTDDAYRVAVNELGLTDSDRHVISEFLRYSSALSEWAPSPIEEAIGTVLTTTGLGRGKVFKPIRIATSGKGSGPHLSEVIAILGRDVVVKRLEWVVSENK